MSIDTLVNMTMPRTTRIDLASSPTGTLSSSPIDTVSMVHEWTAFNLLASIFRLSGCVKIRK